MDGKLDHYTFVVSAITTVTRAIYIVIAFILIVVAVISFSEVFMTLWTIFQGNDITSGIINVLHALLVTIIILEILETVTVYFRTSKIPVKPLLVAGLTAMIRRILVFGIEPLNFLDILATVAVIAVLTVAVVFIGKSESSSF